MGVRLEWRGDEVRDRVVLATTAAFDKVDQDVADAARHDHPGWKSQTGEAEGSLAIVPAKEEGGRISGAVGFGIRRGYFLEVTTRGHAGDRTIKRAAERIFRGLAGRISEELNT
jgi:hypothetical protein